MLDLARAKSQSKGDDNKAIRVSGRTYSDSLEPKKKRSLTDILTARPVIRFDVVIGEADSVHCLYRRQVEQLNLAYL